MNIVMMTNTYKPILGGLEKSVEVLSQEYRKRGHKVLIIAPEFEEAPENEQDVFRVPALQNFNGTDFSVELPISSRLFKRLKIFEPDIVHSHHPFLIGDTALRTAAEFNIPIVFTNHTLYEENTHYVPGDSKAMKKFVVQLAKGYANLCDYVIAPSQSVADMLKERQVKRPIAVVPTGIYLNDYQDGDGKVFRKFFHIPSKAFVIGIVGRVAKEKNVEFLAHSVAQFLEKESNAYFVVVGGGPMLNEIKEFFIEKKISDRLVCTGVLSGRQLVSAYKALDVFVFASHSETQGIVLAEAMAAGTPVLGVDAPGARDIIVDKKNGRIIKNDNTADFVKALEWFAERAPAQKGAMTRHARKTSENYSIDQCVNKMLNVYHQCIKEDTRDKNKRDDSWAKALRLIKTQTDIMVNTTKATGDALRNASGMTIKKVTGLKRFDI